MEENGVTKAKKAKNIAKKRMKKENKAIKKEAKKQEKRDRKDIKQAYTKALRLSSAEKMLSIILIILTIIPIGLDYYAQAKEKKNK